ncbi:NAD(P)-dependent oxidoreductase [Agrobacterium salinitolerans]|uniref:NAD(P)-dependent oxidoreductase n=1 Tax=Agrobacterium salinitolerans TaxID=1183413 RepID=UPI0015719C92|nr:prephenate dehydrogenase/arogenate dehydrogenase family protein [Agrobacterium salinitolerans]NTA40250.1 NAD(P)-dependent oxidoreductase [Agrobacterium salinitolerans]
MTAFSIIGYGEVGEHFAADLSKSGADAIAVFDIDSRACERAFRADLKLADTASEAVMQADVVFVCVTAGAVLEAIEGIQYGLAHGPLVIDINSVSPDTKREACRIVEAFGGSYVEAAVMSSVPPKGIRTPMLLGGRHAAQFLSVMEGFGMDLTIFSQQIGAASAVKMCRSVFIKGLEALALESLLAARHYDVVDPVLNSLADTIPGTDWTALAQYMIERTLLHGKRRAEEMRAVSETVRQSGLEPLLSEAIAKRQDWASGGRRLLKKGASEADLQSLLLSIDHSLVRKSRPATRSSTPPLSEKTSRTSS